MKPVEFVSPLELVCARRLQYEAGNGSQPRASADLSGGRRIDVRQLRGTLNRATQVDFPQVRCAMTSERGYVRSEMEAMMLAWLGALPAPVFNPAHPSGWAGAECHPFDWALRAQAAGFLTSAHRCGYRGLEFPSIQGRHTTSHIIFGRRSFPALPREMEQAAVRLAESSGVPLLGITLAWQEDGQVLFVGATPLPDLRTGGDAFLDALAADFIRS
jgi:hypothetical protein